jgi:F-type H+-transporting ATPase subunit alpha
MAAFAQFGSDLDAATQRLLARGARLTELLKQPQFHPMPVEQQVMVVYAVTNGYLDAIPVSELKNWERDFLDYMRTQKAEVGEKIKTGKELTKEVEASLKSAIESFNNSRTQQAAAR